MYCGRASGFQSKGTGLETTCCRFKTWAISFTPHVPVSLGRYTKSLWSVMFGVYARGSKRSHKAKWMKTVVDSVRLITLVISNSKLTILPQSLGVISCKGLGVISCKALGVIYNQASSCKHQKLVQRQLQWHLLQRTRYIEHSLRMRELDFDTGHRDMRTSICNNILQDTPPHFVYWA